MKMKTCRRILHLVRSNTDSLETDIARFRMFDSVTTLLKQFTRSQAMLFVLDDLHDADQPSLMMLRFVARPEESRTVTELAVRAFETSRPFIFWPSVPGSAIGVRSRPNFNARALS